MPAAKRLRPAAPMPPITLVPAGPRRARIADPLPRLARAACLLAALAAPALGVAAADTIHGAGRPAKSAAASAAADSLPGGRP